ncbi:hypothetical protein PsAD2_01129 [Pseudovibrio axinellae]|uniref:Uncharacterized protein n=1 Tax=Pseudovibrio axinellae TaxID=989403 RepID=A0A166A5J5_9HYPH|nr:hypothetical protein [Pseudovibrio axinellae]KZL20643.1 hypothetical protein PsAD2_01129 [Pseudovibrio axinellae]SER27046.1 hypothetical protein SAMN05421798_107248 [Pseudovibrio axinellae]
MITSKKLLGFGGVFAAGLISVLSGAQAFSLGAGPYIDNRSSPQAVVESYYNAINSKDYPRAYSYFVSPPKDYEKWKSGYSDTASVQLRYGTASADAGMSQIYWSLPVAIETHLNDGSSQVYAGCYVLHSTDPGVITEPPYSPIGIQKGELKATDKPLNKALPTKCDNAE